MIATQILRDLHDLETRSYDGHPNMVLVGDDFFILYESELLPSSRWTTDATGLSYSSYTAPTTLIFRGLTVKASGCPGYGVVFCRT
jgi:hypothetical protein